MQMPRWRFSVRQLMVLVAVLSLVFAYSGSYYRLSRRGMAEGQPYGIPGFLYVPIDHALTTEDISTHYRLLILFAPLNWLDRQLFGGPWPASCFMRLRG